jgi:phosphatidate phosphatase APP1
MWNWKKPEPTNEFSMSRMGRLLLFACFVSTIASGSGVAGPSEFATVYPAYGYQYQSRWVIPLRVWVHERRPAAERAAVEIVAGMDGVTREEIDNFRDRIIDFVADSESRETVSLAFDKDPLDEPFQLADIQMNVQKSDLNGLIESTVVLSLERANSLLKSQQAKNGWLSLTVTSNGHTGASRVELIEPIGLSVISDIDDTIKITEVPSGAEVVARNSFLRNFHAAPGMIERYRAWSKSGVSFHYVSGGPWQMYRPV